MGHELGHLDAAYFWDRWSTTRSSQPTDGEETEAEEVGLDSVGVGDLGYWGGIQGDCMIVVARWAVEICFFVLCIFIWGVYSHFRTCNKPFESLEEHLYTQTSIVQCSMCRVLSSFTDLEQYRRAPATCMDGGQPIHLSPLKSTSKPHQMVLMSKRKDYLGLQGREKLYIKT